MSASRPSHGNTPHTGHRVLFCIGVSQTFFDEPVSQIPDVVTAITDAFADLGTRFGVTILGTMDDDETVVGPSAAFPWTGYILADVPDLDSVLAICSIVRSASIGEHRLWRYLRIEARVGRPLFFGNS